MWTRLTFVLESDENVGPSPPRLSLAEESLTSSKRSSRLAQATIRNPARPIRSSRRPHPLTEALSETMASTADKGKGKESPRATAMIVIGMAGSGKSEFRRAITASHQMEAIWTFLEPLSASLCLV